jgi:hypothetical protein
MAAAAWMGSCGARQVRPDDMSAARHHEEAERESRVAREIVAQQLPEQRRAGTMIEASRKDHLTSVPVYDAPEGYLHAAEIHRQHARDHARAAAFLERFEEAACRDVAQASRAACPLLGPLTRIDDIPGGVRATFKRDTPVDTVLAQMQCHHAYARARGFDDAASCPLYVRGAVFRRADDPIAVEIVSQNKKTATLIRARSREQAVFARE